MRLLRILENLIAGNKRNLAAGSYPAVADILQNMLGSKVWQALRRNTPDRRQLTEEAALKRGVSEEELIKQIAESLGIPVFFKPKPTDVYALPDGLLLPDLRRAGVLPITAQGTVTGVVCVDPDVLNVMPQLYAGSNIYLSSWQAILAALDESEQLYREKKERILQEEKNQQIEIFKQILGRLAEQARDAEAEMIYLLSDMDSLSYSFRDKSEREWTGKIDPKIASKFAQYLEENIAENITEIEVQSSQGKTITLYIAADHGRILIKSVRILQIDNSDSEQAGRSHDGARIVHFPRLVKREDLDLKPIITTGSEPQILLVDDNPTFAEVLQKFLGRQGISVKICHSVEAAISLLKSVENSLPDLILSDLHMPGINGLEFIKLIKEDSAWKDIPVIALTSDESSDTELSLLGVGADAFVTKTKDPRILCLHVKRLVELRRAA